jgi:hypothetical protein
MKRGRCEFGALLQQACSRVSWHQRFFQSPDRVRRQFCSYRHVNDRHGYALISDRLL